MARIRSIKQDFFLNEDLATVSSDARLLAIGLSTVADNRGRLEDRPLKIKAQIFPYHNVDIKALLDELDQNGIGFVQRYSIEGKHYIQITNFEKHQKPHPREPESSIPPLEAVEKPGSAVEIHGSAVKSRASEDCTETITEGSSGRNGSGNGYGSGDGNGGLGSSGSGNGGSVGTGASAARAGPSGVPVEDFTIWKLGVQKLVAEKETEKDARSFLGKQIQTYGKSAVAHAVTEALSQEAIETKSYIVKVLQNVTNRPASYQTTPERRDAAVHRRLGVVTELRSRSSGTVN
jgi:hypothetical protein